MPADYRTLDSLSKLVLQTIHQLKAEGAHPSSVAIAARLGVTRYRVQNRVYTLVAMGFYQICQDSETIKISPSQQKILAKAVELEKQGRRVTADALAFRLAMPVGTVKSGIWILKRKQLWRWGPDQPSREARLSSEYCEEERFPEKFARIRTMVEAEKARVRAEKQSQLGVSA